jgi:gluconolactonase
MKSVSASLSRTLTIAVTLVLSTGAATLGGETLVAEGAILEKLATGFETVEGPLYDGAGKLYFTDIPNQHIWVLDVETLDKTLFREQTGGANGLAFDSKGRLLMCKGAAKCLARLEKDGSETVLFEPVRKNAKGKEVPVGVNDVVVGYGGEIYVTVPGAGSVFRLDPDGSNPGAIVSELKGPNGLMLSPDETKLYVSEYKEQRLHVFDLDVKTGTVSEGKVFATVEEASDYGCDGMTVDNQGNLYCAGPHAVRAWSPEGKLIETIAVPESPTNCAFAGKGSSTLYITGRQSVFRIEMKTAGVR